MPTAVTIARGLRGRAAIATHCYTCMSALDNVAAGTRVSVNQVGRAFEFRDTNSKGMQAQVELKKPKQKNPGIKVMCCWCIAKWLSTLGLEIS